MRRTPTAVSGVWLFLLSSLARRNGLLSARRGQRGRAIEYTLIALLIAFAALQAFFAIGLKAI